MADGGGLLVGLSGAWRDFRTWPVSARRSTAGLVVLIGRFLPAACGSTAEDEGPTGELTTTTTTTIVTTTTDAPTTTTVPPPTTAAPITTQAPPPPPPTAAPRPTTTEASAAPSGTSYANCSEAKAAGAAPISRGEPGYSSKLDRDNDGIACET